MNYKTIKSRITKICPGIDSNEIIFNSDILLVEDEFISQNKLYQSCFDFYLEKNLNSYLLPYYIDRIFDIEVYSISGKKIEVEIERYRGAGEGIHDINKCEFLTQLNDDNLDIDNLGFPLYCEIQKGKFNYLYLCFFPSSILENAKCKVWYLYDEYGFRNDSKIDLLKYPTIPSKFHKYIINGVVANDLSFNDEHRDLLQFHLDEYKKGLAMFSLFKKRTKKKIKGEILSDEEILSIFKQTEALLEGHFRLTSGLHSPQYFQCAKVLQYPKHCEMLCASIAQFYKDMKIDVIVSPALGGIVVGQEVGRQLNTRTIFTERQDGVMQLRRGFEIKPGENVLVCEDVVTTGGSTQEVINIVQDAGGNVVGTASVVDRSGGKVKFNVPYQLSVLKIDVLTYTSEDCPLCKQNVPIMKPGSREIK